MENKHDDYIGLIAYSRRDLQENMLHVREVLGKSTSALETLLM
jgi:hypothetical protein